MAPTTIDGAPTQGENVESGEKVQYGAGAPGTSEGQQVGGLALAPEKLMQHGLSGKGSD